MAGRWVITANRWVKRVSWLAVQGQPVGCARPAIGCSKLAVGWRQASRWVSKTGWVISTNKLAVCWNHAAGCDTGALGSKPQAVGCGRQAVGSDTLSLRSSWPANAVVPSLLTSRTAPLVAGAVVATAPLIAAPDRGLPTAPLIAAAIVATAPLVTAPAWRVPATPLIAAAAVFKAAPLIAAALSASAVAIGRHGPRSATIPAAAIVSRFGFFTVSPETANGSPGAGLGVTDQDESLRDPPPADGPHAGEGGLVAGNAIAGRRC